jgi:hypothetical protein
MPSNFVETLLAHGVAGARQLRERRTSPAAEAAARAGTRVDFGGSTYVPDDTTRRQDRRPTVRRNLRALALAAVGGLLMLAPVSTAFATSPLLRVEVPAHEQQFHEWAERFREAKATQSIDIDSRYDGKQIPI